METVLGIALSVALVLAVVVVVLVLAVALRRRRSARAMTELLAAQRERAARERLEGENRRLQGDVAGLRAELAELKHEMLRREAVAAARETVTAHVPEGATVIVVSRGDQELVELPARTGWHFPQVDGNIWAGYHPKTSADAVRELEELHARGADYFLLPATSAWWLEHYEGLREHLGGYVRVTEPHEGCILFALAPDSRPAAKGAWSARDRG